MTLSARLPVVLLAACLLSPASAFAHALLTSPKPRTEDDRMLKMPPCGGVGRMATPHVFTAGQNLLLKWTETIPHPGYYKISFSQAGDTNWQVLATDIPNPTGTTTEQSFTVTLPSTPCTDCTIQLIQVMLDRPGVETYYYSCTDIVLTEATTQPPSDGAPTTQPPTGGAPSTPPDEHGNHQGAPAPTPSSEASSSASGAPSPGSSSAPAEGAGDVSAVGCAANAAPSGPALLLGLLALMSLALLRSRLAAARAPDCVGLPVERRPTSRRP